MARQHERGFSAIELLITLFVGVAFVATGYQIYSVVIQNNGDARARAKASNIAYDMLRKYGAQATTPCTAVTPSPAPSVPTDSGLSNPVAAVTISCPFGGTSGTSKIYVRITYGNPQQEVNHATYVTN